MLPLITASVGKSGVNHAEDVRTVQTLLNGFVAANRLGNLPLLKIDGKATPTVPYIEKFQKSVAGFNKPDGTIAPGKTSWNKLLETPDGVAELIAAFNMIDAAHKRPPLDGMKADLWQAGLDSLVGYVQHIKLYKPHIVTFMDFRISRLHPRLWTVNILDHVRLLKTHVAHGKFSGGDKPNDFGNSDYRTSLGAYITLSQTTSMMGHVTKAQPAAFVIGLEDKVNDRAKERGIAFHAATYVNPPDVSNSHGCFATPLVDNVRLIPMIANGTFAFAYAG